MTIAIGFRFADGALLSADSQYTIGVTKLSGEKIFPFEIGEDRAIFAISGHVPFGKQAILACHQSISKIPRKRRSTARIRSAISDVLVDQHKKHIYPHPQRGQSGGPDFELLIAVWSHIDGLDFLSTCETAINPVSSYHCMGIGSDLAHFLIANVFRHPKMSVRDTANIAIHVLRETKAWVEYCSGKSQFGVLRIDGTMSKVETIQIEHSEKISDAFGQAIRRLYVIAADLETTEETMRSEIEETFFLIQTMREERRRIQADYESFLDALSPGH